jgi:hypothetical protein
MHDENEVDREYHQLVKQLTEREPPLTTFEEFQAGCRDIELTLNQKFGHPGHTYEVYLFLDESKRSVCVSYRLLEPDSPELTVPRLVGFRKIEPGGMV